MDLQISLSNISWIPVIILTLLSFGLGAFWHSPVLFGKTWGKEVNMEKFKNKNYTILVFVSTAIVNFIIIAGLSMIVSGTGALHGLLVSIIIWLLWSFSTFCSTYLFAGRPIKLLFIDAGMYLVLFAIAGLVLGSF